MSQKWNSRRRWSSLRTICCRCPCNQPKKGISWVKLDAEIVVGQRVNRVVSMIYKLNPFLPSVSGHGQSWSWWHVCSAWWRMWERRAWRWLSLPGLEVSSGRSERYGLERETRACACGLHCLTCPPHCYLCSCSRVFAIVTFRRSRRTTLPSGTTHTPARFMHRPLGCYFLSFKLIVLIFKKEGLKGFKYFKQGCIII